MHKPKTTENLFEKTATCFTSFENENKILFIALKNKIEIAAEPRRHQLKERKRESSENY